MADATLHRVRIPNSTRDRKPREEDGEGAGLYEHFAVVADKGQTPLRLDKFPEGRTHGEMLAQPYPGGCRLRQHPRERQAREIELAKVKPLDRIQIVMPLPAARSGDHPRRYPARNPPTRTTTY